MRRGEIYFVNLNPIKGREQAGRRPVLVVSSDAINKQSLVVTVVVGTSGKHVARDYPVNVRVPAQESGLLGETVFMCFQVRSLDHDRFIDSATGRATPAGVLSSERMRQVADALKLVFNI